MAEVSYYALTTCLGKYAIRRTTPDGRKYLFWAAYDEEDDAIVALLNLKRNDGEIEMEIDLRLNWRSVDFEYRLVRMTTSRGHYHLVRSS